jgi:hypothetical protein
MTSITQLIEFIIIVFSKFLYFVLSSRILKLSSEHQSIFIFSFSNLILPVVVIFSLMLQLQKFLQVILLISSPIPKGSEKSLFTTTIPQEFS